MAGGEPGPAASSIVASAALQLAASRWAYDAAARKNSRERPALLKLASALANDSRQNLLAAHELAVREAQASKSRTNGYEALRARVLGAGSGKSQASASASSSSTISLPECGVPPLTTWWRVHVGAWLDAYESLGVLQFWACVGRGASKSTVLYKLAVFFALFGDAHVPPGERHYAIVLSRLKEEASKGLVIIASWLRMLGVRHHPAGDVIDLDDVPRGIRVVAASVAATSGWRSFFVGRDERSKWPSSDMDERDAGGD